MGGKAPDAPDMTALAGASEEIARMNLGWAREQHDWAAEKIRAGAPVVAPVAPSIPAWRSEMVAAMKRAPIAFACLYTAWSAVHAVVGMVMR